MTSGRAIHRFRVARTGRQVIEVPGYLEKLDVQVHGDDMGLWCMVAVPSTETVSLLLHIVGTGHPVPEGVSSRTYWRTVADGRFIWHIFIQEGVRT